MNLYQYLKPVLLYLILLSGSSNLLANEQDLPNHSAKPIYVLQQANDIPLKTFVHNWPSLNKCVSTLDKIDTINETCLDKLLTFPAKAGALNLKSQLLRSRGDNELSIKLINRAIKIAPEQHFHYFQLAINYYQQLLKATTSRERWILSMATAKAYQKAFELDPTQFHYRYYITYNYLQVPEGMGGSKQKALDLANEAITQGYVAFHPVRADILYAMNQKQQALRAYITALDAKQYKRSSFEKALQLTKKDPQLTQRFKQFILQAELSLATKTRGAI